MAPGDREHASIGQYNKRFYRGITGFILFLAAENRIKYILIFIIIMNKRPVFLLFFLTLLSFSTRAQLQIAGGVSMHLAPMASYNDNSGSGMLVSVFGDIIISEHLIARAQASRLLVSTFSGGTLNSSFAANGPMGYNAVLKEGKLEIPFMATLGYINIWYPVLNDDFYDASLQVGGMITPTY